MKTFFLRFLAIFSAISTLRAAEKSDFIMASWTNFYQQKTIVKTLGVASRDGNPKTIGLSCVLIPYDQPTLANTKQCLKVIDDPAHFARISAAYINWKYDPKNVGKHEKLDQTLQELGYPPKEFTIDEGKEAPESIQGRGAYTAG